MQSAAGLRKSSLPNHSVGLRLQLRTGATAKAANKLKLVAPIKCRLDGARAAKALDGVREVLPEGRFIESRVREDQSRGRLGKIRLQLQAQLWQRSTVSELESRHYDNFKRRTRQPSCSGQCWRK